MISTRSTFKLFAAAVLVMASTGCSSIKLPNLPFGPEPMGVARYKSPDATSFGALSEKAYNGVRQAKAQNSVVLEVVDDSEPVRVLPLPGEGKSVYVSNLLEDTGVADKLGTIEATLYRQSTEAIGGLPMEVLIAGDGQTVLPESDYALQPGDRLRVNKGTHPLLKGLLGGVLGI